MKPMSPIVDVLKRAELYSIQETSWVRPRRDYLERGLRLMRAYRERSRE